MAEKSSVIAKPNCPKPYTASFFGAVFVIAAAAAAMANYKALQRTSRKTENWAGSVWPDFAHSLRGREKARDGAVLPRPAANHHCASDLPRFTHTFHADPFIQSAGTVA